MITKTNYYKQLDNMMHEYKYMVCTRCFTYNQSKYIKEAMQGFTMQETTFPVVTVIVDDASTDGEPDVIRKYLSNHFNTPSIVEETEYATIICANHKTNVNCQFVVLLLKYNHYSINKSSLRMEYVAEWLNNSKYVAICEGDDYWLSPMKLQRQVDFMEVHQDYSMCFHNAIITYDNQNRAAELFNSIGQDREIKMNEILDKWICPTQSILARTSIYPRFPVNGKVISGDWRNMLHCVVCGKVWFMKSVMSCYRKTELASSLSNTYSRRSDELFFNKVRILEGLEQFTQGKNHAIIAPYIRYYSIMGQLIRYKKQHGLLMTCIMRPLSLFEIVWKRSIRPKFDKNAPTYSA